MIVRTLSTCAALALLLLCCACSSAAFQPAQQIIHVDRSASAQTVNATLKVKILVQVEAPADPRVPDLLGNLVYPDEGTQRVHERWLKAGIREDARMQDFILFSQAYEYNWWQGGGGLTLSLQGKPDMTRLALSWGKHFPDVVKDLELSSPVYSRTTATQDYRNDPRNDPATYYPYAGGTGTAYYPGGIVDPYSAYCPTCGLARLNCICASNCCGNQVQPRPQGAVDGASGPFVRK